MSISHFRIGLQYEIVGSKPWPISINCYVLATQQDINATG